MFKCVHFDSGYLIAIVTSKDACVCRIQRPCWLRKDNCNCWQEKCQRQVKWALVYWKWSTAVQGRFQLTCERYWYWTLLIHIHKTVWYNNKNINSYSYRKCKIVCCCASALFIYLFIYCVKKVKAVCGSYSTAALRHIVLLTKWVPSFISRGSAHTKRGERPLLAKEGTIPGI